MGSLSDNPHKGRLSNLKVSLDCDWPIMNFLPSNWLKQIQFLHSFLFILREGEVSNSSRMLKGIAIIFLTIFQMF